MHVPLVMAWSHARTLLITLTFIQCFLLQGELSSYGRHRYASYCQPPSSVAYNAFNRVATIITIFCVIIMTVLPLAFFTHFYRHIRAPNHNAPLSIIVHRV